MNGSATEVSMLWIAWSDRVGGESGRGGNFEKSQPGVRRPEAATPPANTSTKAAANTNTRRSIRRS
jgi:hypothetical protein